ncbi:MAG TPA: beta-N-acetylhexosaminidase [Gaiellaceae bacterium]|nr:beta-N-acetylhexosaminidase [Gaiellaceae bacterium]
MSEGGLEPAAAACLFPGFEGRSAPDWLRRLLARGLGGVVLFSRNVRDAEQLAALTASLRAEQPEVLIAIDEEGGDVTRLEATTGSSFPGNLALGAIDDAALTRRVAAAIGGELAAVGLNMNLAPVADVLVDPATAIVGVRSFGSDPQLVARHVAAFVGGLQSVGVAACAKHFPGHGETTGDSHLECPVADTDLETLRARALPPFEAAVAAHTRLIMTAHVRFAAVEDVPATLSPALIGLLRAELGFDGVVLTDALEMQGAGIPGGIAASAVTALAAGADALCLGADVPPAQVEAALDAVVAGARAGQLGEERLRDAAVRVAALGAWAAAPQPRTDRAAGAEAARRALRVEGDPVVGEAAVVVDLRPEPTIPAGPAPYGLGGVMGVQSVRVGEGESLPALDATRLPVFVVRDAHLYAWQRALVPRQAVVVETGVPEWRPDGVRGYIAAYGSGRASLEAVAEVLRGR